MRLIHPNRATILYGGLSCAFSWFLFGDLAGLALRTHTLGPWFSAGTHARPPERHRGRSTSPSLRPHHAIAFYGRIISHLILGQTDKASRYYQTLLTFDVILTAELSEHF